MRPCDVITVLKSNLNLRQIQIQSSQFSAHRQMLYTVMTFQRITSVCVLKTHCSEFEFEFALNLNLN